MIPIKRKSFINRYRILSDVFVFSLAATIQSPKVYYRITVDSVSVQRRIIANQSYGIFTYVSPHTWVVVLEPIVVQSGLFVLRQTHWRNKSSVVSGSDLLPNPFYAFIKTYSLIISNNSSLELS